MMKTLVDWIAENPGKCSFLQNLLASGRVPLAAGLLEALPEDVDLTIVVGRVTHDDYFGPAQQSAEVIIEGRYKFFVLTKNETLTGYIGQTVRVSWIKRQLIIEPII